MKVTIVAALLLVGMGLASSPTMAAPADGSVISQSAAAASPVTKAWCGWRRACGPYRCWRRWVCW
jgi:hypothetical protein